jgi:peroxiredoxin
MWKTNLIATLCLLVFFAGTEAPVNKGYQVGDKAIDFKLKNIDGKMLSMADFKDAKGFIVIFDCNTCPYSKMYNERIKELHTKYAGNGYPVIAINSNDVQKSPGDSYDAMIKHAGENGIKYPYLYDEDQNIATTYGATNTPHVYLLKKKGADLVVSYIGAIDNNPQNAAGADKKYLEDAIAELEAGKAVSNSKTKAIGCTIKWKSV